MSKSSAHASLLSQLHMVWIMLAVFYLLNILPHSLPTHESRTWSLDDLGEAVIPRSGFAVKDWSSSILTYLRTVGAMAIDIKGWRGTIVIKLWKTQASFNEWSAGHKHLILMPRDLSFVKIWSIRLGYSGLFAGSLDVFLALYKSANFGWFRYNRIISWSE